MTDEAKRFLNLKEDAQVLREIEWTDCAMNPRVCITMMHKAADLIESLSAELEQVKCERDAAVEDLRGACVFCAHVRDCLVTGCSEDMGEACKQCPCKTCFHDSNWQWRGPQEVPND